ncbi:LysR substrate-binding domain-containing protein [Ensifer sp. YR511]|uniref:LysR substrate-binding domain-containing protein n=1 Tax=Ensifer sp. YR511 TaxID=1855294 RepID=UPI000A70F83E|nr:LysR substrate-binding domain-containing protein [Ensifer sp. YR511]
MFPRIGNLEDSSLIARKIRRTEASIFAAPALIAAHGMSLLPSDLTTYPLIGGQIAPGESQTWTLHHAAQDPVKVEFKPRMCANSVRAISEAIEAGIGIGRLPAVIGRRMVAEGTEPRHAARCPPADRRAEPRGWRVLVSDFEVKRWCRRNHAKGPYPREQNSPVITDMVAMSVPPNSIPTG